MSDIPRGLHDQVVLRAGNRCEYLALACVSCSLRKWANQTAIGPETGNEVSLFNPRTQAWAEHFRWDGERVIPLTPTGRATVAALEMNRPIIVAIRQEEIARGRHPPG